MAEDQTKKSVEEEIESQASLLPGRIRKVYSLAAYLEKLNRHPGKRLDAILGAITAILVSTAGVLASHANGDRKYYLAAVISFVIGCLTFWWFFRRFSRNVRKISSDLPQALKGLYSYSNSEKDGKTFLHLQRQKELSDCFRWLEENNRPVLAIWGRSGSGKTSLLRAGIQYQLEHPEPDLFEIKTPVRCLYWPAGEGQTWADFARFIESSIGLSCSHGPIDLLSYRGERLVIIIDEFERLNKDNPEQRSIFDLIAGMSHTPNPHRVQFVVSINFDDLGEWLNFKEAANLDIPRVMVSSLKIDNAIEAADYLLVTAGINIDPGVLHHYMSYVAESGAVSPIDIAIATISFATRKKTSRTLRMKQYEVAGGALGVLRTYVNDRLGPANVIPDDYDSLVRGLTGALINTENDLIVEQGASLETIAQLANLPILRTQEYLDSLTAGRVLESPVPKTYRLSHQRLIRIFKDLVHTSTSVELRIVERYQLWIQAKGRKHLLSGSDLDWVLINNHSFLSVLDAANRIEYIDASVRARKRRYALMVSGSIILVASAIVLLNILSVREYKKQLSIAQLPTDLYERQIDLESLTIDSDTLETLEWLHSSKLTNVSVNSSALQSVNGLQHLGSLHSVDIDLNQAPINSLRPLGYLRELQALSLHHINRTKTKAALDIPVPGTLTSLDIDFSGEGKSHLPDLAGLRNLARLTLDLGNNTTITELPSLATSHNLSYVRLVLDHSKISSIKSIALFEKLTDLDLSLDSSQMKLLKDLSGSQIASLTLRIDSYPPASLPDLSYIPGLRKLNLIISGAQADITSIRHLTHLHDLSISAIASHMTDLPDLEELAELESLDLNLESSRIQQLPEIIGLKNLGSLTLNLNGTHINTLPDFTKLTGLLALNLAFRYTKINSLNGLDHLKKLQILTLDLVATELSETVRIPEISSLRIVNICLSWKQIQVVSDFAPIPNLRVLRLNLTGSWEVEELPDLKSFAQLEELELSLDGATIESLPDLSKVPKVKKIKLNVERSHMRDLTSLASMDKLTGLEIRMSGSKVKILRDVGRLKNLQEVVLDISHSQIKDLINIADISGLQELTIDQECISLAGMPNEVRKLHFVN